MTQRAGRSGKWRGGAVDQDVGPSIVGVEGSLVVTGVAEGHEEGAVALVDVVDVIAPTNPMITEPGEPIWGEWLG